MAATSELTWRHSREGIAIDCHASCGPKGGFELPEIATVFEPNSSNPMIRINPVPVGTKQGQLAVYGVSLYRQLVEYVESRPWRTNGAH